MRKTKYALIGSGPAALFAAEAIRQRDSRGEIVMIGAEGYLPYYRPLTSYYLGGLVSKERLFLREKEYFRQQNIEFIEGIVTAVKGQEKLLFYQPLCSKNKENNKGPKSQGEEDAAGVHLPIRFEKLLIAPGASPVKPDIPGIEAAGVYTLRTIEDAEKISAGAKGKQKALLLGGGLVSLKAAYALHKLGLKTTLVVSSRRILSQMLDEKGASLVADVLEENGLEILLGRDAVAIEDDDGIKRVTLDDGGELKADLVIVGKGVKPATSFLQGSGIAVENGLPVDKLLQTNLPDIYGAGDAILCRDLLLTRQVNNALWPNATEQGSIAGANMSGEELPYRGSMRMNATEFFGLPVIAAGLVAVQEKTEKSKENGLEFYEVQSPRYGKNKNRRYLKLVFQEDRLVGYIAIGENRKAGMLTSLITSCRPLSPQRKQRLINGNLAYF